MDAGEDGALRGPDKGPGAGGEVVLLQVHHANQAVADFPVRLDPLDIEEAVLQGAEQPAVQIGAHGGVDGGDALLHVRGVQPRLGEDEPQGGGGVSHVLLHRLPILGLGGELVAGHHGPLCHIRALLGQEDVGGIEA